MDNRRQQRARLALPVCLSSDGRELGIFYTRDLALDGLFLQSGPVGLRCNDPVMLNMDTKLPGFPMSGYVVHLSDDGIGVRLMHRYLHYAHDVLVALEREGKLFPPAEEVA